MDNNKTEFNGMVDQLKESFPIAEYPHYRIEAVVESMRDWSVVATVDEVAEWFRDSRINTPMKVTDIRLSEMRGWNTDPDTGNLVHSSGEFFIVNGIRVTASGSREVGASGWDQPILTQVGYDGGILGLLRKKIDGIPHYYIEAKAEPGNYKILQMSPTLQATFSNLKKAHGGRKPHFAELFEEPEKNGATVLYKAWLAEDGGRLFNKRNLHMLVEVDEEHEIPDLPGFQWLSLYQIKHFLHEDAWINPHIRGIIAHI